MGEWKNERFEELERKVQPVSWQERENSVLPSQCYCDALSSNPALRRVPHVRNTFANGGEVIADNIIIQQKPLTLSDLVARDLPNPSDLKPSYKWSLAAMNIPKVSEITESKAGSFASQFLSITTPSQIRFYLDRYWARGD